MSAGAVLLRSSAAFEATTARSMALTSLKSPLYSAIGVLAPSTMTMSFIRMFSYGFGVADALLRPRGSSRAHARPGGRGVRPSERKSLHLHPQILHEERVLIGDLFDLLRRRLAAAVARARFDANEHGRGRCLRFLNRRGALEAVAGHDAVIRVRSRDQRRRILRSLLDVVVRRIGIQRLELVGVVR